MKFLERIVARPYTPSMTTRGVKVERDTALRRQLLLFAAACIVISGGFWLAAGVFGGDTTQSPQIWLYSLGACGPSLAALVAVIALGRGDVPRQRIRRPWLWAPAALVLGALPVALSSLILSGADFGSTAADTITALGGVLPFIAIFLITGPLAEEFGWRGYVQPRLRMRLGVVATAAVLGSAWAVWHIPLFLLTGTLQNEMGLLTPRGGVFLITLLPLSVVYLFVSERLSGGVWAAILLHFSVNATGALFPQADIAGALIQLALVTALALGCLWAWRWITPRAASEVQPPASAP